MADRPAFPVLDELVEQVRTFPQVPVAIVRDGVPVAWVIGPELRERLDVRRRVASDV
jgi:hypothetical protein